MFGKKKKEEKSLVTTTGNNQHQNSSITRTSGSTIEQRIITQTITNYSSSVTSTTKIGSTFKSGENVMSIYSPSKSLFNNFPTNSYSSPVSLKTEGTSIIKSGGNDTSTYKPTQSLFKNFPTNASSSKNKVHSIHEIDAKPFNMGTNALAKSTLLGDVGYQSPFSRKLPAYRSTDARPFNPGKTANQTSSMSIISTPSSRSQSPYTTYRPLSVASPSALSPSASTHSLPSATESNRTRDIRIPTYNTNGKNRGKVLIINNINFLQENQNRKGAETDEKNINKLFKDMGFAVDTYRNLKKSAMMEKVIKFKSDSFLKKVDISVVVMMSHGSNIDNSGQIVQGGFTQIYGIDDVGLSIDDILNQFSSEICPALAGKPKIFIFQCCRGTKTETLHNDAKPMNNVKKHGDMLIAFSTLPGFYSLRDTKKGSWYIECICDVFRKHAKEFDIETLLKIVDEQLSKKHPEYQQTSTYESRGFKCCYLNPK